MHGRGTWRLGLVALATAGCTPARPGSPTSPVANAPSDPVPSPGAPENNAPADQGSSSRDAAPALPEPARYSPIETACDGKDEDGDGHADLLVPAGANECATSGKGACARGWVTCLHGKAMCDAPPAMPEV